MKLARPLSRLVSAAASFAALLLAGGTVSAQTGIATTKHNL